MAFYPCAIANCIFDALVYENSCYACRQRFCFQHYRHPLHECSLGKGKGTIGLRHTLDEEYEPEVTQLLSCLDVDSITTEVELLRPGHQVATVHVPVDWEDLACSYMQGQSNFHIKIDFQDGVSWSMRIRRRLSRNYTDEPLKLNIASEVTTIQALQSAGVAVPNAYAKPSHSQFHPKLIYCYQSMIPGEAWAPFYHRKERFRPPSDPSVNHVKSLARWFINMEKAKFDKVGSITCQKDVTGFEVGPIIDRYPYHSVQPYFLGPFHTSADRWIATIEARIQMILERRYCSHESDLWMYLALLEAKELVRGCDEMRRTGPFFIKHDDDEYDHIRANEAGEVTGVIDWEWSYTTTKHEAFISPSGYLPDEFFQGTNDSLSTLETALMEAYISFERPDLADCVKNGRKYHRLNDMFKWMMFVPAHLDGLYRAFNEIPDATPTKTQTVQERVLELVEKYKDNAGLKYLLENPLPRFPVEDVFVPAEIPGGRRRKKKKTLQVTTEDGKLPTVSNGELLSGTSHDEQPIDRE